jgi:glycosyltransferase involved in cell wall biosynthesis
MDNLLYRFVFRNTDVILLSSFLYPDIQKYVPLSAVHYCPNGIKAFENTIIPERENERIEILFLSNMIRSKGVFVLLEACNILNKRNLHFHCTFIGGKGDITEEEFKTKVAEYKLDTSISYVGKKLGKEKNDFLANANIFVLPTYYEKECFPLVLLEAMQASLPVVSTYEGGIPDIVEDGITGYLVPQKDSNALAEKLEILIQNKKLSVELGKKGRIRYEKNFTLPHFEHTLSTILKQIVSKRC